MTSQKFPLEQVITIGNQQNLRKIIFMLENTFMVLIYTSLCIYMVLKRNKIFHTVFDCSRRLVSKTTAATPPPPLPVESILLELYQNVSNR